MAKVQLIDGRIIEGVKLTGIRHVGDEGSRSATAHIGEQSYSVYNSIVDGLSDIWYEQMDMKTWRMLKGTSQQFMEGSATNLDEI